MFDFVGKQDRDEKKIVPIRDFKGDVARRQVLIWRDVQVGETCTVSRYRVGSELRSDLYLFFIMCAGKKAEVAGFSKYGGIDIRMLKGEAAGKLFYNVPAQSLEFTAR